MDNHYMAIAKMAQLNEKRYTITGAGLVIVIIILMSGLLASL